jgi:hypothetical protein
MRESQEKAQDAQLLSDRPPLEAREIVLILCDHQTIKEHLDQGIEQKLLELGVGEMGAILVKHVDQQEKILPKVIYRPYQKAISDYLEKINYAGMNGPAVTVAPSNKGNNGAATAATSPATLGATQNATPIATAPVAPPPLPQAEWFLGIGGQQQGPFDLAAVGQKIAEGVVTRDTLVWKPGLAAWSKAGDVPETSALFAPAPPPLPPPLPTG